MKLRIAFVLLSFFAGAAQAADVAAPETDPVFVQETGVTLEQYKWVKRPIVVFAYSPSDPRFVQQMSLLHAQPSALATRDVVVLSDTDPEARSALRNTLRPRGFMMVLIGKDGVVYLRKPAPWDVREITRSIDKLPLRQQEIKDRREAPIR
ncbi:DUF4174 domain-containing protein [Shimia litoralis]|uniref:DUF4174 domain-containing protein n=1 Tax=Shimia litoralis TaxID=420403 RepID=A0A4U7N7F7_9RHOB|nr:DUF4174 domain-containing protein [Shimia litoralis]TKZ21865.1 DUF4174 domain-containing protein [Shimia litoralis]